MRLPLALASAGAAAIAACTTSQKPASDTTGRTAASTSAAPAPGGAAVRITSPAEGATTGADVTVTLSAQGVTIAKANGTKAEGVGHHHLFLDTIPTADGATIPATTKQIVHIGTGDSTFTFKGLAPGRHQIIAVIGYGDHTPMPTSRDTVVFTVKP